VSLENGSDNRLYVYDGAAVLAEYAPDPALDPTKAASGHHSSAATRSPLEATGGLIEAARSLRTTADNGLDGIFKARQYLYGTTLLAAESFDPSLEPPAPSLVCYHLDSLGSTVNLTAGEDIPGGPAAGTVTAAYLYDAWGNYRELDVTDPANPGNPLFDAIPDLGPDGLYAWESYLANIQSAYDPTSPEPPAPNPADWNRLTYTGHEFDPETGLYYFKARFYDPELGRFASADPYLGDTLTPPSLHRYLYAYANPLRYVDLTGYAPGYWWDPRSYDWAVFLKGVGRRSSDLVMGATETSVNAITAGQLMAVKALFKELSRHQARGATTGDMLETAGKEAALAWTDTATAGGLRQAVGTWRMTQDAGVSLRQGAREAVYNTGNQVLPVDEYAVLSDPQASLGDQIVAGSSGMIKCTALAAAAAPVASRISAAVKPSGITTLFNEGGFVAGPRSAPRPVIVQEAPSNFQMPRDPYSPDWNRWYVENPNHPASIFRSVGAKGHSTKIGATRNTQNVTEGTFSISDWTGYPEGIPKPTGPFRLLQGEEYSAARQAANNANRAIHKAEPSLAGKQIHEIVPVKFDGSPTNLQNKIPLPPHAHSHLTKWWNNLLRQLQKIPWSD